VARICGGPYRGNQLEPEERSSMTIDRNALVFVFLEYFKGIMLLTTNRAHTFDPAFQSRIHIALQYHDLGEEARTKIRITFLQMPGTTGMIDVSPCKIALLAKRNLNARIGLPAD